LWPRPASSSHMRGLLPVAIMTLSAWYVWSLVCTIQCAVSSVGANKLFTFLRASSVNPKAGFLRRDVGAFEKLFTSLQPLERSYFLAFSGFIAREHQLAKTGLEGIEEINGQAALWLDGFQAKQERYDILNHLHLSSQNTNEADPVLAFAKSEDTNPLANFRVGDIAVLYPFENELSSPLHNQLFKCTIVALSKETVSVRLRSKQFNTSIFETGSLWNLEHDLLDSGFIALYRSLYKFLLSPAYKKELLLTTRPPAQPLPEEQKAFVAPAELTTEQQHILQKIIAAKDYFLLWGPPGTGKTSMMLKHLVDHLLQRTDENILLLAYTNRAVDEICESIERLGPHIRDHYVRIGSRYSTGADFYDQLLSSKTAKVKNRKELRDIIEGHRIFVSTVASISNKPELLAMKKFNTAIIDEASQILEPMLAGLLPDFDRWVLIGDHKQLPAVVVQDEAASAVHDEALMEIGLDNLRNSLFERLYHTCCRNEWDWAYAQLSHQGRMHETIMQFPNRAFYESTLKILPAETGLNGFQIEQLSYTCDPDNALAKQLSQSRTLYFPTPTDPTSTNHKTNLPEAKLVAKLVRQFQSLFHNNKLTFNQKSLGIITPFRAQIATIRHELSQQGFDPDQITIDTVERYQGGARDVIIISLCTNRLSQLRAISSFSKDGKVDRKLNVALTRARKHLVVLGNEEILSSNAVYRELMEECRKKLVDIEE
ncbi:MAG: AAA domain-containing protein, partial [Bacteroidota bacterium]